MKFRFKTQKYQVDAVNSVVGVFGGQPYLQGEEYTRDLGINKNKKIKQMSLFDISYDGETRVVSYDDDDDLGYSNASIKIDNHRLLTNIKGIQNKANLHESSSLYNKLGSV